MYARKVEEFHKACDLPINKLLTPEEFKLRLTIIGEEMNELAEEIAKIDLAKPHANFAKEMVDLIYVLVGTGVSMGIDMDEAFRQVHKSNMSKVDPKTGKVAKREDGKVLKGDNYVPANLQACKPEYKALLKA